MQLSLLFTTAVRRSLGQYGAKMASVVTTIVLMPLDRAFATKQVMSADCGKARRASQCVQPQAGQEE